MKPILKKWVRLAAVLAAFAAAAVLAACAQSARPGTVRALLCSPEKFESLQAGRTPSETALVTGLSIGGTQLVQDRETGVYFYSLPQGAQGDAPRVSFAGKNGTKLKILQDFAGKALPSGGTVQLLAYTKTEYQTLQLVCTPLPILSIWADTDPDRIEKNPDVPMSLTLYDNRASAGVPVVQATGTMHVRGRGSTNYPKKGYRLELTHTNGQENDMALLGLRSDGDWILYAGYAETEKVRQVFSAKLWHEGCSTDNEFGVPNSNDYKFLELFLNGRYWGLYALGYPIDNKQWQLQEGEYAYFKVNPLVWEPEQDYTEGGKTPGYELAGGADQDSEDEQVWQPLNDYYQTFFSAEWEDRQVLYTLADEKNAIDTWLFIDLIQGVDQMLDEGRLYNMYLVAKKGEGGTKILYTPWDFDRTWGFVLGENNTNYLGLEPEDHVQMTLNPVEKLIAWEEKDMIRAVYEQWQVLRAGAWSNENVQALLDGCEQDIFASGAYDRDYARWPDSGHNDGQTDLSDFRTYVAGRFREMDSHIQGLLGK